MTIPTLDRLRSLEGPFGSLTATAADLLRIAEAAKREAMGDG